MLKTTARSGLRSSGSTQRLLLCVALCTILAASGWPPARAAQPAPTIPALLDVPARSYRAFRRMHATNEKFNQEGWVECWTELDPQGFRYEIVSERGSDYIREKILKTLLRREQELIAAGSAGRAEINDLNYELAEGATAEMIGNGERAVPLKARRKDILLVNGRMVLNEDGTELLRVEGRLSKNPSFWTNVVDIVREFARLDGVRVPISTDTIAKLKLAGTARMDVRYNYESINGRPVSLEARQITSAALPR